MYKKITFLLTILSLFFISLIKGQISNQRKVNAKIDSFYSLVKNHVWMINTYLITDGQKEKKNLFKDYSLRFNNSDSSQFHLETSNKSNIIGSCKVNKNGKLSIILPLFSDESINYTASDSLYNEVVKMLTLGQYQLTDIKPSKIKLRSLDPSQGETLLEIIKKE